MEQTEVHEQSAEQSRDGMSLASPAAFAARPGASVLAAQGCPTCAAASTAGATAAPSYIYSIGRIEPRFSAPIRGKGIRSSHGHGLTLQA